MPSKPAAATDPAVIEAWCRQAVAGDTGALQRLLCAHHRRLEAFLRRKVGVQWQGRIEPEDVLQEAYVEVFAAIRGFAWQGAESFYHWASEIVAHRFYYHVRYWQAGKRRRARETGAQDGSGSSYQALLERCLADTETPSRVMQRAEAASVLMSGIAALPEDYRQVIQRLHLKQEPLSAVAADMGRSEDAVRRLAGRALERLQRHLGRASRYT